MDPVPQLATMTVKTLRQQLTLKTRKSIILPNRPASESKPSVVPVILGRRSTENSDFRSRAPLVPVA